MPIVLSENEVNERSTLVAEISFLDEDDTSVTPNSVVFSLVDVNNNIINSRDRVVVTPAATINIVLSDDDLALTGSASELRFLVIEATYDSALGTGLTNNQQIDFVVTNLKRVGVT